MDDNLSAGLFCIYGNEEPYYNSARNNLQKLVRITETTVYSSKTGHSSPSMNLNVSESALIEKYRRIIITVMSCQQKKYKRF